MFTTHLEHHTLTRLGWLRAAVLGANDGIISTASLIIGVAAANTPRHGILIAGIAGLIAGTMSMAAGEYVSVSSQKDTEKAQLKIEQRELEANLAGETEELTAIYVARGLKHDLAETVAKELMAHDALEAHARDELGITDTLKARPLQAALSSALSFGIGSLLPILVAIIAPIGYLAWSVAIMTVLFLCVLGILAAKAGGAKMLLSVVRVVIWGSIALLVSATIGSLLGLETNAPI